jgi:HSP20 family protein
MTMLTERFAPLFELQRDLNRFLGPGGAAFAPAADVLASEEEVVVHVDVPGLSADELDIELENDVLTVRGQRAFPYGGEGGGAEGGYAWQLIERSFGTFERVLRVPAGLDPDAIEATVADGVLTLRIPKPETLKPRRIKIGAAAGEQRELEGAST